MNSDLPASPRPDIRYRPGVPKPVRSRTTRGHRDDKPLEVFADWPEHMPVTAGEVWVIETYLSDRLDGLLARCTSAPAISVPRQSHAVPRIDIPVRGKAPPDKESARWYLDRVG